MKAFSTSTEALIAFLLITPALSVPTALTQNLETRADSTDVSAVLTGLLGTLSPFGLIFSLIPQFDNQCQRSDDDKKLISTEIGVANAIAHYAHDNLKSDLGKYYRDNFVAKSLNDIPDDAVLHQLEDLYGRAAKMVNGGDSERYKLIVTCDDSTDFCKKKYYAHMGDSKKTMNLCDKWFANEGDNYLKKTEDILGQCKGDSPQIKHLEDLWFGKAQAILHEWTHTKFVMGGSDISLDYAYQVQNSLNLASGSRKLPPGRDLDKSGKPICPDADDPSKPGFCAPELSIDNADTLAIMAGGLFFSDKDRCHRDVKTDLKAQPQALTAVVGGLLGGVIGGVVGGLVEEGQYLDLPEVGPPVDKANWGARGSHLG
ncbi:MAG: hypothetical protein Q9160_000879 [Pyrenula sp. 1 TL-2023]